MALYLLRSTDPLSGGIKLNGIKRAVAVTGEGEGRHMLVVALNEELACIVDEQVALKELLGRIDRSISVTVRRRCIVISYSARRVCSLRKRIFRTTEGYLQLREIIPDGMINSCGLEVMTAEDWRRLELSA